MASDRGIRNGHFTAQPRLDHRQRAVGVQVRDDDRRGAQGAHRHVHERPVGGDGLILQDVQTPPLPAAVVGSPLAGAAMVTIPFAATSTGIVTPAILPPTGGSATGLLAVQSPPPLPGGTLVQANVSSHRGRAQTASGLHDLRQPEAHAVKRP